MPVIKKSVMSIEEVSRYLGLGTSTVYRLAKRGELPGRKLGGRWLFSRVALDRWLEQPPEYDQDQSARKDVNEPPEVDLR